MSKYWRKKIKHQLALAWIEVRERADELISESRRVLSYTSFYKAVRKYIISKRKTGFTLIELMIVLVILGTASTAGIMAFRSSQKRARDATRKADLNDIKTAFEDYYNDNRCYPPTSALDSCGGSQMKPYLRSVPCDPQTKEPYLYVPLSNRCQGYRVYAGLESDDEVITELGCGTSVGCGWGEAYNYGVAAGTTVFDPNGEVASSSPPEEGDVYACAPGFGANPGRCNIYSDPVAAGCSYTFTDSECQNKCSNALYWCDM